MTGFCAIPVVETERLILREYQLQDFDAYAEFFASDRASFVGGPKARRDAWFEFASDTACWQLRGRGMWAVESRATGKVAGWVGVVEPEFYDEPELGWMLTEESEGKGLAFEAAQAARTAAQRKFGLSGLASFITAGNDRSVTLAERLGAVREDTRDRGNGPFFVYRHPVKEAA